jgi:hypothetical protein
VRSISNKGKRIKTRGRRRRRDHKGWLIHNDNATKKDLVQIFFSIILVSF